MLIKLALAPWLLVEGRRVRRQALVLPEAAGPRTGQVTSADAAPGALPWRVLIVGDSSAAGVGAATQDEALAGQLAYALAQGSGRPVAWQLVARTGLRSAEAVALLQAAASGPGLGPADVAVVALGVNDVVAQVPAARAVAQRERLVAWLAGQLGVRHVAFAALPPMHRFPLLPQPLRWVLGRDARRHDAALARWARGRARVSHVPFDPSLGADAMAHDGFHPGPAGYRAWAAALAHHLTARDESATPAAPSRPTAFTPLETTP